jgi:uncharacterized caspase-like protein
MPLADRALVVGINRYPGITDLSGPENDAREFFDWVTSPTGGGVLPANARLIVSSQFPPPPTVRDALPAQEAINNFFIDIDEAAIENNKQELGLRTGNRLWMFFSGHGFAPSLEMSGVLMANATLKYVFNVAAVMWANRLFEGGWFNEIILFQDACRNRISAADLTPPFFPSKPASATQARRRFFAFSSKDQKLSMELPFPNGRTRGVFTATLMDGLRGAARDPVTGAITTRTLKTYLQDNMQSWLSPAHKANPEIATEPDVRDYDTFDIVPAATNTAAVNTFPVAIALPAAGAAVVLQDGKLQQIDAINPAPQIWKIDLPRGIYRVVVTGGADKIFKVEGPGSGAGGAIDVLV